MHPYMPIDNTCVVNVKSEKKKSKTKKFTHGVVSILRYISLMKSPPIHIGNKTLGEAIYFHEIVMLVMTKKYGKMV